MEVTERSLRGRDGHGVVVESLLEGSDGLIGRG